MATIKRFEDLVVWQKARILCQHVHEITHYPEFSKDYKLKDQINSSSGSTMDNIAEGFGRQGNSEFGYFLSISNGSVLEVASQLYRAYDRQYITSEKFSELLTLTREINNMIGGLIEYLAKSEFKGQKYKAREKN